MPDTQKQFADPSVIDHFNYLDDILIDNRRIGPAYFDLLNDTPPSRLAPPGNLTVR